MIRLFRSTETNFTHNEWILNEIISCKPTEGINDDFTMELEYPLEDSKNLSSNLIVGAIISVPTIDSRTDQLFRIIDKDTSPTTVTIQAQAKLLADLKENRVRAMTLTGLTRKQAIQAVLNACLEPHSYSVGSLDANTNTNVIVNVEEGNPLSAIIGAENSILSEYGGEFIVNNNTIDIIDSRGSDNGVVVEHGKNISSISEKTNNTDLATVLIPKAGDYRLPEYCIESPNVNKYEKRYFKDVELNLNIWDGENEKGEDQVTIVEAYTLMRAICNKMFNVDKVDQMTFNYTVDFVELSKTEEYKNYAILETVNLGDTVTVKHKKLNLDLRGRVNDLCYTVDSEGNKTIDTVSIGFARKDITDIIKATIKSIKFAKDEILLSVKDTAKHITAEFKIADNEIKQSVTDLDKKTSSALTLQANKINAVVQAGDVEGSWELNESAFIVAFKGSSNGYSEITGDGITIYDGRFRIKKGSNTVFYVNTSGRCTADGGFVVDDGDSKCKIDSDGITMTNDSGYTSSIYVASNATELVADDDFTVIGTLRPKGTFRAYGYAHFNENVDIDGDLDVSGDLTINGQSIQDYIDDKISASK